MQRVSRISKQQMVHDAVFDAALVLFTQRGFDETTVDEIAEAAGISRRSFFRYFESKNDLLSGNVVAYSDALVESVRACKRGATPLEAVRQTVEAGLRHSCLNVDRLNRTMQIAARHPSARQAFVSRISEVEEALASAYAAYLKRGDPNEMEARLLAGLTLTIVNASLTCWFQGASKDPFVCSRKVFKKMERYFGVSLS